MNSVITKFFKDHNINPANFDSTQKVSYEDVEINHFLRDYVVFGSDITQSVSIADIVGCNYKDNVNIKSQLNDVVDRLCSYYDDSNSQYSSRNLKLLNLPAYEIISQTIAASKKTPIRVEKVEDKYILTGDGRHRYHLLRVLYLDELCKIKKPTQLDLDALRAKYRLNAVVTPIDYVKTYCWFLLDRLGEFKHVSIARHVENDKYTNKSILEYVDKKDKTKTEICTDEWLIKLTYNLVYDNLNSIKNTKTHEAIEFAYQQYPSFKEFIDTYFKDLIKDLNDGVIV